MVEEAPVACVAPPADVPPAASAGTVTPPAPPEEDFALFAPVQEQGPRTPTLKLPQRPVESCSRVGDDAASVCDVGDSVSCVGGESSVGAGSGRKRMSVPQRKEGATDHERALFLEKEIDFAHVLEGNKV